jgi:hypothetical protein
MFRSCSYQLICSFMTWHPYQLNSVMFGQLYEGLVAVPDHFEVIWYLPSALIAAWLCMIECRCFCFYSSYLDYQLHMP